MFLVQYLNKVETQIVHFEPIGFEETAKLWHHLQVTISIREKQSRWTKKASSLKASPRIQSDKYWANCRVDRTKTPNYLLLAQKFAYSKHRELFPCSFLATAANFSFVCGSKNKGKLRIWKLKQSIGQPTSLLSARPAVSNECERRWLIATRTRRQCRLGEASSPLMPSVLFCCSFSPWVAFSEHYATLSICAVHVASKNSIELSIQPNWNTICFSGEIREKLCAWVHLTTERHSEQCRIAMQQNTAHSAAAFEMQLFALSAR